MSTISLFRDAHVPSAREDRLAHERFLLDTHLDRRDPPAVDAKAGILARVARLVRRAQD